LKQKKITYEIKDALLSGDLEKFGKLLINIGNNI